MSLLTQFLTFAATLAVLMALSRWINRQVQIIGLRVTDSSAVAVMLYYLLMFPGILLHELSHYLTALLLGLKVSKFAMGPQRRRNAIELGSVTVQRGGAVRDSLVGFAPFVAGTAVLLLIAYQVFDVTVLGQAWTQAGWSGLRAALADLWQVSDVWVWAYVVFVVSNAMTPSSADRQPWLVAGVYLAIALVFAWLLGGLSVIDRSMRDSVAGVLQVLTLGFIFSIAVNLAIAAILWGLETVVIGVQRPKRET